MALDSSSSLQRHSDVALSAVGLQSKVESYENAFPLMISTDDSSSRGYDHVVSDKGTG